MIKPSFYLACLSLFCLSARAQSPDARIDIQHYNFYLKLNDQNDTIKGKAEIAVKYLRDADSFGINLKKPNQDGKGMLVSSVTENGAGLQFQQHEDVVSITASGKAGSNHNYTITYQGIPGDGLIISTNKFGHRTFFGDNWPNRAHNWLPCVDDPDDKATVDFIVIAPDNYLVVANGLKIDEAELPGKVKQTHWRETAPLPTKVMVIGVADFAVELAGDVKGIPVSTYVFPENKQLGFKGYAVAKEILAYYIEKVGPYAYEKLANVQSKTIFGGMENASCIFYFENSVGTRSIEDLMAHEIAHQWFGDAASEKNFSHLWLSEGFATYMTNVYLEHKYGTDTLKKRLQADRKTVLEFEKSRQTPVVDTTERESYMKLLNANSYQKGGWVLHMLRCKLGEEVFWKGIRAYYAQYENSNANTDDLRSVMEQASGENLEQFFKQWLYSAGSPHLNIVWKYKPSKKALELTVVQNQAALMQFPLEIKIAGKLHKLDIKNKTTSLSLPLKSEPSTIAVDPNSNLLADFSVKEAVR